MALRNSTQGDVKASLLLVPQRQRGAVASPRLPLSQPQPLGMQVIKKAQDTPAEGMVLRTEGMKTMSKHASFSRVERAPVPLFCRHAKSESPVSSVPSVQCQTVREARWRRKG